MASSESPAGLLVGWGIVAESALRSPGPPERHLAFAHSSGGDGLACRHRVALVACVQAGTRSQHKRRVCQVALRSKHRSLIPLAGYAMSLDLTTGRSNRSSKRVSKG